MSIGQRLALFLLMMSVNGCYLLLNRLMDGGRPVDIWLDQVVPFWPAWIVPYLLAVVWWQVAQVWAYLKMNDRLYLTFAVAWVSASLIGFTFFLFYPTYMVRPPVIGNGWAEWLIRQTYANDKTYNAFPSMHVWCTVLISLVWSKWKPKLRGILWVATFVVALSTLFTGQHWIVDVFGGICWL